MNIHTSSSSVRLNVNNNAIEFDHSGRHQENPTNTLTINGSFDKFTFDQNLIRPIPKKVDLSRIIYQQFMDPYPRQNQSRAMELNNPIPDNYLLFQQNILSKMCRDAIASGNIPQHNNVNGVNEFSNQIQNSVQFNDPRFTINPYLSSNSGNHPALIQNQFYTNNNNLSSQHVPVLSSVKDSYMLDKLNHQVLERPNQMNCVSYNTMNQMQNSSLSMGMKDHIPPINNTHFFPKISHSDYLIENHFTMSLNPQVTINCKETDLSNKKSSKQSLKTVIEKPLRTIRKVRKSKSTIEYTSTLSNKTADESPYVMCATPSDSSISPNSMVSCRSTITPQSVCQNFNNPLPSKQHQMYPISTKDKVGIFSDCSLSNTDIRPESSSETGNKKSVSDSYIHGLPLKKRLKWQIEEDADVNCSLEDSTNDHYMKVETIGCKENKFQLSEMDQTKSTMENNDSCQLYSEDPLETFQKTFLPMEKHLTSSDTESDEELDIVHCKYHFPRDDFKDLLFTNNNI